MIVYVESNFILELAYLQEEHDSCEALVALAEARSLQLLLPAYSLIEARVSRSNRAGRRRKFHDRLKRELRELLRSKPYRELLPNTDPLTQALIESVEEEKKRLEPVLRRLVGACQIIPTQGSTINKAAEFEDSLSAEDALVLASIIEDLGNRPAGPKAFLNRNARDFANPDIEDELRKNECKLIPSFKDGLAFVQTVLHPKP